MSIRRIGDTLVTRIEEALVPMFDPTTFLVPFERGQWEKHLHWMVPNYFDVASHQLMMSFHSYVIRTPHHTILVDSCVGNHKDRMPRATWHQKTYPYLANMRAAGIEPEEVDIVLCTHLHIDHVGWNTRLENGRWVPTFPNATYLFGQTEFDYWHKLHQSKPADPVGFGSFADSVLPIVEAGKALMMGETHAIDDSMLIEPAPGHSPGHVTLRLASDGQQALFVGDIIHHPIQVYCPDWNSRACLWPDQARASRRKVLDYCANHQALMLPAHFGKPHAGLVHRVGDGYRFEFVA
jgi:glyoxylase-like metal-dependent hydrolase (beta-lactamase superfamily II)